MEELIGYIVVGGLIGIITGYISEQTQSVLIPILSFMGTIIFISPGCILGWIIGTVAGLCLVE